MPDELDRLLDDALSAYTAAPERPGLEERVLRRTREAKRRRNYWVTYGSLAAAIVIGLIFVMPSRFAPQQIPPPTSEKHAATLEAVPLVPKPTPAPAAMPAKRPVQKRLIQKRHTEPKRYVFPTPSPLTTQETALLEIAHSQPAQLAVLSRPLQPLDIPLIQIEPLDKGKN